MKTRKLGNTELELTTIGLGTWAIGGADWKFGWGPQEEKESVATIRRALELGINWIDTAAVYGFGESERVVGKAIAGMNPRPIIATKCGLPWDGEGNILARLKKASVRKEVEDSLRRLNVEQIDLYQIHRPRAKDQLEEGWECLGELIDDGKIRYAGVSNFSVQQMQRMQTIRPIASLQPPYSLLSREIDDHLAFCRENNIGVIIYSPMQKGILTDKFSAEFVAGLPKNDHRIIEDSNFREPNLSKNLAFVKALRRIAGELEISVAQLAIAWTLHEPVVTAAIVGARHPGQIEQTVPAADIELPESVVTKIETLHQNIFKAGKNKS